MPTDPSLLGTVQDVTGATVSVELDASTVSGLLFVGGQPYHVGQVGAFVRIALGFTDLVGVVSQAGASAVPDRLVEANPHGRKWLTVQLVGEGSAKRPFSRGISVLPSIGDAVHLVTESSLSRIYGLPDSPSLVRIGRVASASSVAALVNVNKLISRHAAVVGSTGAGKSTTVVRILESLTDKVQFPSARVIVFDVHGEYASALPERAANFSIAGTSANCQDLHVPYWALTFEELVPLTFGTIADDASLGAIRDAIIDLKREALARKSMSGVEPERITVDTPIPFSIHELWFRMHRRINGTHSISNGQSLETEMLLKDETGDSVDAGDALAVRPASYQGATQAKEVTKVYLSESRLNLGRQVDALASRLRDRRYDFLFRPGPWAPDAHGVVQSDLDSFLESWLGKEHPVCVLDLSGVPAAVRNELVGCLTRIIYDALLWARLLSEGGRERPVLLVFEEAHTYLGSERSNGAKEAVQRVVKEGRKYGVGAMIVSQRPSEVDPTVLSQCGTVVALRLTNAMDRGHVTSVVADNLAGFMSMLPVLRTGEAIVVGESVALPMRVVVDLPTHLPRSADPAIAGSCGPGGWDRATERTDYGDVVRRWRLQDPAANVAASCESGETSATKGSAVDRRPVSSSMASSIGYDEVNNLLEVEFASGDVYHYFDVPPTTVALMWAAPSLGAFITAHIRGQFRFTRV